MHLHLKYKPISFPGKSFESKVHHMNLNPEFKFVCGIKKRPAEDIFPVQMDVDTDSTCPVGMNREATVGLQACGPFRWVNATATAIAVARCPFGIQADLTCSITTLHRVATIGT